MGTTSHSIDRRGSPAAALAALALLGLTFGCGSEASRDPGVDLPLRIQGAQLVLGGLPAANGGPDVTFLEVPANRVHAGDSRVLLGGRTGPTGYAVHVGLRGGTTHWIVPVGLPDSVAIEELTWSTRLDFAPTLPAGDTLVDVVAVDGDGRAGPTSSATFSLVEDVPAGALVFSLAWDRQVDLDLHVVLPDGTDLGPKDINSFKPPAPGKPPAPPDAWMSGGRIDFDSNAACVIDGRRVERAVWTATPPAGRYVVYVDLARACGEPVVSFWVTTYRDGVAGARAGGTLYEFDARQHPAPPGGAPGLFVMELEVN